MSEVKRVKCQCACHSNSDIKHVMPCCDGGWIEVDPLPNLDFLNSYDSLVALVSDHFNGGAGDTATLYDIEKFLRAYFRPMQSRIAQLQSEKEALQKEKQLALQALAIMREQRNKTLDDNDRLREALENIKLSVSDMPDWDFLTRFINKALNPHSNG